MGRILMVLWILTIGAVGCAKPPGRAETRAPGTGSTGAAADPSSRRAHALVGPRDVLFVGRTTADVMQMAMPPRGQELNRRMKEAVSRNQEWFLEALRKAKPGQPLPYDPRLGLTAEEYGEFLALTGELQMQKVAEAPLTIREKQKDVYALDGGKDLSELNGIEIDLREDQVRTPFGTLAEWSSVHAGEESALGPWNGVQWKLEEVDGSGTSGRVVKLALGRLAASERCILYYDVKVAGDEGPVRITRLLNFDRP